jgi:hypothetical protein
MAESLLGGGVALFAFLATGFIVDHFPVFCRKTSKVP